MKDTFFQLRLLTARDVKLYFKDRMAFLVSLITPMILLLLFVTFMKRTYEDQILSAIQPFVLDDRLLHAFSGGWLFSSVLATSCVTVSFCSGMMVSDKVSGCAADFLVAPVKRSVVQCGYVLSNLLATWAVCFALLLIGLVYLAVVGFYLTFVSVLIAIAGILLTTLFATAVSNIVWTFTRSQGVVSAVCTLLSALYGFICGAYMPIASMGDGFAKFTSFLPGTYSTVLFRKAFLVDVLGRMEEDLPSAVVSALGKAFDVDYAFFERDVSLLALFLVGIVSSVLAILLLLLVANKDRILRRKER